MKITKDSPFILLRGAAMGIAEVIPGVSGGTIAFITGIYARLLSAIRNFDLRLLKLLGSWQFQKAISHIDGAFLLVLVTGMVFGVIGGIFGVTYILETRPDILWGFFFGLILASVWAIGREVSNWDLRIVLLFIGGASLAFFITLLYPLSGSENLLYVFLSGCLAICALILPGISGSFILLLLGMYTVVIPTVKNILIEAKVDDVILIAVFAAGCLAGLLSFSKLLSWLFNNFMHPTLATMTGFMLGSLPKIWPWRNPALWMDEQGLIHEGIPQLEEGVRVIRENIVLPADYYRDTTFWQVIIAALLGIVLVVWLAGRMMHYNEEKFVDPDESVTG